MRVVLLVCLFLYMSDYLYANEDNQTVYMKIVNSKDKYSLTEEYRKKFPDYYGPEEERELFGNEPTPDDIEMELRGEEMGASP